MSTKQTSAAGARDDRTPQSSERRKERRDRIFLGAAAAVLAVAAIVFVQSWTDKDPGPAPTSATDVPAQTPVEVGAPLTKGGTLEPAARKVAIRFLETAVGRTSLDEAWALATPELRGDVPLSQWRTGELPVVPFPVDNLETTGVDVVESSPNKVLLQVLLVPKPGTPYVPTRYDMTIERASKTAPWKVSYCTPYAPPGMYVNPE